MPPKKRSDLSLGEMFAGLGTQLALTSVRPNIHGYKPHQKQVAFHASQARGRLYIGGNRSGKTTGGVVEDIWIVTKKHPYRPAIQNRPVQGRVIGVDFLNGIQKIILPEFARWLPPSELIDGSWERSYSKGERVLTLANGSFIEFMSYDQDLDKFAGVSRDFVHYDEEPPQDIFIENSARLLDVAGSWFLTMTPVNGMTWIYDDIYLPGKQEANSPIDVIEVHMDENPYLPQLEVAAYAATLTSDDREARLKGKFIRRGGLVYKTFSSDTHVIDVQVPPKDWEWYASVDHGYNNPTAWLWHAVSLDGTVITFAEHYESERTVDYHAATVHAINASFGRVPDYYVGDPALSQHNGVTGTTIFEEYASYDMPIAPANNDVLSGINKVNQYLQLNGSGKPTWYVTRNCINLIQEISRLRWKTWASKRIANDRNKHDAIHKKDDHACDSLRYFMTFLPDLTPDRPSVAPPFLQMPFTPVGVDAFVPHFKKDFEKKNQYTEWTTYEADYL